MIANIFLIIKDSLIVNYNEKISTNNLPNPNVVSTSEKTLFYILFIKSNIKYGINLELVFSHTEVLNEP